MAEKHREDFGYRMRSVTSTVCGVQILPTSLFSFGGFFLLLFVCYLSRYFSEIHCSAGDKPAQGAIVIPGCKTRGSCRTPVSISRCGTSLNMCCHLTLAGSYIKLTTFGIRQLALPRRGRQRNVMAGEQQSLTTY